MPPNLSYFPEPKAKSQNPWGKTLELIMDSATPGKPTVQNDMIGCCSGLVIGRHEHNDTNLTLLTGTFSHGRKFSFTFWNSGFCNFMQNDLRMKGDNWINGSWNFVQNAHEGEVRFWKKNPVDSPWGEEHQSLIESMFTATLDRLCMQNDIQRRWQNGRRIQFSRGFCEKPRKNWHDWNSDVLYDSHWAV